MNYLKSNPVGIDVNINRIQSKIHDPLLSKWEDISIYGRVYKKPDNNGKISLQRYTVNGEYKPVSFSEGNKIFFVQGTRPEIYYGQAKNDLWAVCTLKLDNLNEREDEKVHIELVSELQKAVGPEAISGLEYGMNNFRRLIEDPLEFGNFKYGDIHPYHLFMVKMEIDYQLTINEC